MRLDKIKAPITNFRFPIISEAEILTSIEFPNIK
jgi:hypothetical protein